MPGETAPGAAVPSNVVPATEEVNPASVGIDRKNALEVVETIHTEDCRVADAVRAALPSVARLVDRVAAAFRCGGRLIYLGAGTSGRLGVLDASECPPTFGVDPELVVGVIAGGESALRRSIEGAEDSPEHGAQAVVDLHVGPKDVVCGIAASGTTPYVLGALEAAQGRGASTALITCNPKALDARGAPPAEIVVSLAVGPEVIAGSTRMKSGTATKMVLNMVTTGAMIRWGKVYDNLMVDVRPVNRKLVRRAVRLIEHLGRVDAEAARSALDRSGRQVKVAIVMARRGVAPDEARSLLDRAGGLLRRVIDEKP